LVRAAGTVQPTWEKSGAWKNKEEEGNAKHSANINGSTHTNTVVVINLPLKFTERERGKNVQFTTRRSILLRKEWGATQPAKTVRERALSRPLAAYYESECIKTNAKN